MFYTLSTTFGIDLIADNCGLVFFVSSRGVVPY